MKQLVNQIYSKVDNQFDVVWSIQLGSSNIWDNTNASVDQILSLVRRAIIVAIKENKMTPEISVYKWLSPNLNFLRIKLKSLASESRIIRYDELKLRRKICTMGVLYKSFATLYPTYPELIENLKSTQQQIGVHRRLDVRRESRASYLAYGYIRGIPYAKIERSSYTAPDLNRVVDLIYRFGNENKKLQKKEIHEQVKDWVSVPALTHNSGDLP